MPAFAATLKPLPVTAFSIPASVDMHEALSSAQSLGMRGTINADHDREDNPTWDMQIVDLQGHAIPAKIGDVFVWNGIDLTAMSQADFDARYDIT